MSKKFLLVISTIVVNVLILVFVVVFVDSTYCKPAWWLIILGFSVQGVCAFLLLQGGLLPKKETSHLQLSREGAVIMLLGSFFMVYGGSLGIDETGRINDCPNTLIQHMYK